MVVWFGGGSIDVLPLVMGATSSASASLDIPKGREVPEAPSVCSFLADCRLPALRTLL